MAAETIPVQKSDGQVTTYAVHRDGNCWVHSGKEVTLIANDRGHVVRARFKHNGVAPFGITLDDDMLVQPGGVQHLKGHLDVLRFNDAKGLVTVEWADQNGDPLPDDDGSGHPDNVTISVIDVFPASTS